MSPHAKGHLFTKRTLLADLNRVFDSLGFLAPILISGKIFIQQLWQPHFNWDTVLPADMSQRWHNYTNELCQVNQLKVVRKVKDHPCNKFELHGFCDASMNAFIYLSLHLCKTITTGQYLYMSSSDREGSSSTSKGIINSNIGIM